MKFFSYIFEGEIHISENQKIIPAGEFSSLMDSSEVLEKAKKEAEKYRLQVQEECEILKEEARQQGFQEGLEKFNEQLMSFEKELRRIRHETQKMVLPLALKAAKKIVNKELEMHPETIVDVVLQALAPAKQNHRITIYVNKQDKEALEQNKNRIKDILEQLQSLAIQERQDVNPGGCIIETESGIINASIENQWKALEMAFNRYMK